MQTKKDRLKNVYSSSVSILMHVLVMEKIKYSMDIK